MTDTDDHKTKMQDMQAKQREKVAELADPEKGLVLVHTGNGKGKSSSAFGVIIRALGWKQKVGVVQLGEVTWHTMGEGFTWDTQDKDRDIAAAKAAFAKGRAMMESGDYDLIVMDEINIALRYDYLAVEDVIAGLQARDKRTGVILTGRDAKPELCAYADLVTEMTEVKHPFHNGIKAQRGVDF